MGSEMCIRDRRKTELIEIGTERIVSYGISPQKLDKLVNEMIKEET